MEDLEQNFIYCSENVRKKIGYELWNGFYDEKISQSETLIKNEIKNIFVQIDNKKWNKN